MDKYSARAQLTSLRSGFGPSVWSDDVEGSGSSE